MNKKVISLLIIVVGIVLTVVSFMLLPDNVVVQVGFNGQPTNSFPKLVAIMIPLAMTIVGSLMNMNDQSDNKKMLVVSIVGILAMILTLFFNL